MEQNIIDVVIVGAGPAGLQAAVHAARKKASVVVFGKGAGSSISGAHVENYLCVGGVTDGAEMLAVGRDQARRFGAEVREEDVLRIELEEEGGLFNIHTETSKLRARTVILSTGTARKKLKVPGEKELAGRGVSYCVDCDANFFRNAPVAVVGNGSAAVDGALTLLGYTPEVYLVSQKLDISSELEKKLKSSAVRRFDGVWVEKIQGESAVESVLLSDDRTLAVEGVFIELGAKGAIELAINLGVLLDTDTMTHIDTNKRQETNITGIYAAGDIAGQPYQMAKAVGEGCVAGWEAANYANHLKRHSAA
ncbi:MAG: FAD-dependent oxidoreductase [Proteobacteria bacterium]|nr:FAD-binding protein [Desulfobulbaceae bacterium]MBU4152095.1 FAD-dependent oxidoreductase [Pseudomonadota bacterium]MDP2106462.1 FAD-dependent oxidoreductase [Desulfobulbaceae bacterium]